MWSFHVVDVCARGLSVSHALQSQGILPPGGKRVKSLNSLTQGKAKSFGGIYGFCSFFLFCYDNYSVFINTLSL